MATLTPNYSLEKPDSTDDFKDFRASYNDNMDIIDANLGGGGGSGGHTILDPSGTSMPQEDDLQFTGKVSVSDDNVNQKTVVDVPAEIVELTQAQYEALPATKLTDGIAYFIKDVDNASVEGYPPLIYSLEEREVGVWADGKPLYQKTINFGALPNNTSKSVAHNISDLGYVANIKCVAENPVSHIYLPIPFSHRLTIGNQIQLEVSSTDVSIYTALDRTSFSNCYVTLEYTKTTDTAGSGTWNGQGGLAHHYSTSEKIIGTWIDSKPIYEKTVVLNNLSVTNNQWAKTNESATDIETIIGGFLIDNQSPSQTFQCDIGVDGGKIAVLTWFVGNSTRTMSYLIFRYTKTTD